MDILELRLLGWLYTVACAVALLLGAWLTLAVHRQGGRAKQELAARMLDDLLLFSIWLLGLAGGIGVLNEKAWSRWALELFCWALVVLSLMSSYGRWRAVPPPRGLLLLSLALFLIPILAFCAATVLTLRGETALRILSG